MALVDRMVGELMARHPRTVEVFVRYRMACPGCLMASFMTVGEAAAEHDVDEDALLAALDAAIAAGKDRP